MNIDYSCHSYRNHYALVITSRYCTLPHHDVLITREADFKFLFLKYAEMVS